jgi:hypothetical protein
MMALLAFLLFLANLVLPMAIFLKRQRAVVAWPLIAVLRRPRTAAAWLLVVASLPPSAYYASTAIAELSGDMSTQGAFGVFLLELSIPAFAFACLYALSRQLRVAATFFWMSYALSVYLGWQFIWFTSRTMALLALLLFWVNLLLPAAIFLKRPRSAVWLLRAVLKRPRAAAAWLLIVASIPPLADYARTALAELSGDMRTQGSIGAFLQELSVPAFAIACLYTLSRRLRVAATLFWVSYALSVYLGWQFVEDLTAAQFVAALR